MLDAGQKAPDFNLPDQDGTMTTLSQFRGKKVVIYFYPKDDTPGCTREACSFRDNYQALQDAGAVVLGVSADDEKSHTEFREKYSLPFPLLADTEKSMIEAYGAWGVKKMYGKEYEGVMRSTVIVDEDGTIMKVYPKVKPDAHAQEVLEAITAG